ncbi:MAG: ferrous iron transport protein A [Magnetococcus sp. DMHC-8]
MNAFRNKSTCTLLDLTPGQRAEVIKIETQDGVFKRRLTTLGLVPGVAVDLDRSAPLGDPRIYSLMGSSLGLRNCEACCVQVSIK